MAKSAKSKPAKTTKPKPTPRRGRRRALRNEEAALKRLILCICTALCVLVGVVGVVAGTRITGEMVELYTVGAGLFSAVVWALLGVRKP